MDSERLLLSTPISRSLPYPSERSLISATSKAMPYALPQKPSPSILERFKVLLKQRDDELRASAENDGTPPLSEEIVQLYELLLSELTFNSKPIITDLTIIAGDQRQHGKVIADVICARILEVPADQKLPSLYLLDSIVKNIGREYIRSSVKHTAKFILIYIMPCVTSSARGPLSFPLLSSTRLKISYNFLLANQQSSGLTSLTASESPRLSHGIHVNPKYLHKLESGVADGNIQHEKGVSRLKGYGQKPVPKDVEYNSDHAEFAQSNVGAEMLSSGGNYDHTASAFRSNQMHSSSSFGPANLSSPSRLEPDPSQSSVVKELKANDSRGLFVEKASPSHGVFDYRSGLAFAKDDEIGRWRKKNYLHDNQKQVEAVSRHRISNGHGHEHGHEGARALIDAYGSDEGKKPSNDHFQLIDHQDMNGFPPISWQNTEEEEFDWEDMSPILVNRSRSDDTDAKFFQAFGAKTGLIFDGCSSGPVKPDTTRSWFSHGQLRAPIGFSLIAEDVVSSARTWNVHNHVSQPLQRQGVGRNFQKNFMVSNSSSFVAEKVSPLPEKLPTTNALHRSPAMISRMVSPGVENSSDETQFAIQPKLVRPPLDILEKPEPKLTMLLHQHVQLIGMNPGNQVQSISFKSNVHPPLKVRDNFQSSPAVPILPHLMASSLSQGFVSQVHNPPISVILSMSTPAVQLNLPINNIPSNPLHLQRAPLPPLPPGPHPASMHLIPMSQTGGLVAFGQQTGSGFCSLINTLMSQGLISLTNQNSMQDSIGLEFNLDILKLRHEYAISALYTDLPRQCPTCGLRFKSQEEHSSHMDWHVTKNRMSKSRKQKPSRKWFVGMSMWLSGAEAVGTEAVRGFLPTETIVEKDSDELAVPADADQNTCALCGEPFDDFYSDELEEWMYKGAVFMNAPDGLTTGMDKTQLGPIVHAKCRSDSSSVLPADFGQDEGGFSEEGNRRKRPRS